MASSFTASSVIDATGRTRSHVQDDSRSRSTYAVGVKMATQLRGTALVIGVMIVAACTTGSPGPSTPASAPSTRTAATASPPTTTEAEPTSFPLAVVTGITNLKATTTTKELGALASRGELVIPCGVKVTQPALTSDASGVEADRIAATLKKDHERVASLITKVSGAASDCGICVQTGSLDHYRSSSTEDRAGDTIVFACIRG